MSHLKVSVIMLASCGSIRSLAQEYESYQLYLGSYPEDANCGWHHDAQGVAHDDDHWFITQTEVLWKIPVGRDLLSISDDDPDVTRRPLDSYPELWDADYRHLGDPVVYRACDTDYLLVPIEHSDEAEPGAIAIVGCDDNLTYLAHFVLTHNGHDAGWCAVDNSGRIVTSREQYITSLLVYHFDWFSFCVEDEIEITFEQEVQMIDVPDPLETMQGGEFAPGDGFLYLISGFHSDNEQEEITEGLHVLDTRDACPGPEECWRRVGHSTNGYGHFNYYYNAGGTAGDEPEGLTIWDLDDGRAPGIRGQLHALMLDNDEPWPLDDDVYLYHYTNIIRVDAANAGSQDGTPDRPFRTVGGAANLAWYGAQIRIQAGTYDEAVTISKRVRLTAEGGTARIGG